MSPRDPRTTLIMSVLFAARRHAPSGSGTCVERRNSVPAEPEVVKRVDTSNGIEAAGLERGGTLGHKETTARGVPTG